MLKKVGCTNPRERVPFFLTITGRRQGTRTPPAAYLYMYICACETGACDIDSLLMWSTTSTYVNNEASRATSASRYLFVVITSLSRKVGGEAVYVC